MHYIIDYIPPVEAGVKQASARDEVSSIMQQIYQEDPSFWPYGLDLPGHHSVYMIRDSMTKKAAGFVGWQQLKEGEKLIGSYTIGILPEHRGKGFAKEAVSKIIEANAKNVDEVRAYVEAHNGPSLALANSIHIPVFTEF